MEGSTRTQQQQQQPSAGSATLTVESTPVVVGTLTLVPESSLTATGPGTSDDRSTQRTPTVVWADGIVDNEFLNRKKSKVCCIYKKPRAFDESSSSDNESCCSSSDDQGNAYEHQPDYTGKRRQKARRQGLRKSHTTQET